MLLVKQSSVVEKPAATTSVPPATSERVTSDVSMGEVCYGRGGAEAAASFPPPPPAQPQRELSALMHLLTNPDVAATATTNASSVVSMSTGPDGGGPVSMATGPTVTMATTASVATAPGQHQASLPNISIDDGIYSLLHHLLLR